MITTMTDRTSVPEVDHPLASRVYRRRARKAEYSGVRGHRETLLAGLSGTVVEIGAGSGLNFPLYPPAVETVIAIEPEPSMRQAAEAAAHEADLSVRVLAGAAEALPLADASVDAGVASLVLCSVEDLTQAVAELFRVIRPGGELRFYEHVVSARPAVAGLQRAADATLWPRVSGGCHLGPDTLTAVEGAGFRVEECERFGFSAHAFEPPKSFILGRARRP
jgi:SAM-dependent methyltransferase